MQHYVKAIYELSSGCGGVRISDIATKLEVTKASSSVAIKALQEKKMVYRDANRLVFLTEDGEYQAILALDKFAIIRGFLTEVLDVEPAIADSDACAMEHVISTETLCTFCRRTNRKCTTGCHAKADAAPEKAGN